jgi:hypothetical protein
LGVIFYFKISKENLTIFAILEGICLFTLKLCIEYRVFVKKKEKKKKGIAEDLFVVPNKE